MRGLKQLLLLLMLRKMLLLRRLFLQEEVDLEVDRKDIEELVQDYRTELTTEELVYIQNEQQKNLAEEQSSKNEE